RVLRVAPVVRDSEVVSVHDDLVAALEARVGGGLDGPRHVDARHGGELAHDPAGSVVRERVLVVDGRVLGADDHVPRIELVGGHFHEAARDRLVVLERAIGLELVHRRGPPPQSGAVAAVSPAWCGNAMYSWVRISKSRLTVRGNSWLFGPSG